MNKQFKLRLRATAFIVSLVMLFTYLSTGIFSFAASSGENGAFILNNADYTELDNGWYDVSFKNTWGDVIATWQTDLTKGIYFSADNFADNNDWLMLIFLNSPSASSAAYASNVKIRHENGRLVCAEHIPASGYDAFTTDFGTAEKTHLLQAVPVISENAVTGYRICIDGIPFNNNGFIMSVEDFNNFNNYNEETQSFDGCYLRAAVMNAPRIGLALPGEDGFTGSLEDNFTYIRNSKGYDDVRLGANGYANSTWQADLNTGVSFTVSSLEENDENDWMSVGMSGDPWELRRANAAGELAPSFRLKNIGGKLAVSCYDGKEYGEYVKLGSVSAAGEHTIKAAAAEQGNETVYKFYIDGHEISGFTVSEAEFNLVNNGTAGAYIGFAANTGADISDIYRAVPDDVPFSGSGFVCEQTEEPYTLDITAWNSAFSTWRVDLTAGISFNVADLPETGEWVSVGFYWDYWNMPKGPTGDDRKNHFTIMLRNDNGKIRASYSAPGEFAYTTMDLSVADTHVISVKPFTDGEETKYRFNIDGQIFVGNADHISADDFKILNNYDETTGTYKGAYVRFGSNCNIKITEIEKADLTEEYFTEISNFSAVSRNGSHDMKIGNYGIGVSAWRADLTKGIIFSLNDLTNNAGDDWVQFIFLSDSKKPNDTYTPSLMLKHKDGQLYASATDGAGEWCMTYFGSPTGTHILKAVPVTDANGNTNYQLSIDGKDFNGIFAIPEADFKKINNYNEENGTFSGAHIKFHAATGAKVSVFVPGDAAFTGEEEGFSYNSTDDGKYNLNLSDNGYAISTWQVDLTAGVAFSIENYSSEVSIRLANSLWTVSRDDSVSPDTCQPIIKLREDNGNLSVSISNDSSTESFSVLEGVSAAGEHILSAKRVKLEGAGETYKFYIDDREIGVSYYLNADEFYKINNYDASSDTFSGATLRFATEKSAVINNIYKAVDFEGVSFSYKEVSDGHYNLNISPWSYAISKWKADLTSGFSFNVEQANGWIMIRFSESFENMYTGMPGDKVSTYQPVMLMKNDTNGLYVAMMSGGIHKSPTVLKGMKLEGTHVLTTKLAPDSKTGVMYYRFYLDGIPIVQDYTMSIGVLNRINGYDKESDTFRGANIFFGSENGAVLQDIHKLVTGKTVQKGTWDTNTDADIVQLSDNVFNLSLKAFSSLRSSRAVNMEKGMTFTLVDPAEDTEFGIALSMLPGGTLLDVPPIITDGNGIYYLFSRNDDGTYHVISSSGLSATWNGDLAGRHTYSMVRITDRDGLEKYTLAIDGKAVFDDGMEKSDYIMFSNASRGSYPTIFAKTDVEIKDLTGDFLNIVTEDTDGLWDDEWDGDTGYFDDENDSDDWYDSDDDYYWDSEITEDDGQSQPVTERVLVGRVKIDQEPIITYEIDWWLIAAAVAAAALVIGGVILFVPFKKGKKK